MNGQIEMLIATDLEAKAVSYDAVMSLYIRRLLQKDSLTKEDIEICFHAEPSSVDCDGDIADLVMKMAAKVRESSHGACQLKKVFIRERLYSGMNVPKNAVVRVGGIPIVPSEAVEKADVEAIGICESKFKLIAPDSLVSIGFLRSFDALN